MYSNKITVQLIANIFFKFKINQIVISPGSRNAPISITLFYNNYFKCFSIVDERSAGFIALGMSQFTNNPTVLCCTSGSAVLNYYPAIVEAFYQNIPLIIITADRPKKYINIFDGQTIKQNKIFSKHIYFSCELSDKNSKTEIIKNIQKIKKTILFSINKKGPVHINFPLSDPLYKIIENQKKIKIDTKISINKKKYNINWNKLLKIWHHSNKIMILVGLQSNKNVINQQLEILQKNHNEVIILCESTSNLKNASFIQHIDPIISNINKKNIKEYLPDLLITIGQNITSKKIKIFLRSITIKNHWHIDLYWFPNTYNILTEKINISTNKFLSELIKKIPFKKSNYQFKWKLIEKKRIKNHNKIINNTPFSDLKIYDILSKKTPKNYIIHFSNSSPIRYSQLFNFYKFKGIFSNRGVSGIDGCTSTSIGFAIQSNHPVLMISGDLSFFYDINALWNNYIPSTFRLIVINNSGGDIFRIISNFNYNNTAEKFFIGKHTKSLKYLALHFNFKYLYINTINNLINKLSIFFKCSKKPKLMEINTSSVNNSKILEKYFHNIINNNIVI